MLSLLSRSCTFVLLPGLLVCTLLGCRTLPPDIQIQHGLPPDRYNYLGMAVYANWFARGLPDSTERDDMLDMSRDLHDVWKRPHRYVFPDFPASWSTDKVKQFRRVAQQDALDRFLLVIHADPSTVPYESDVREAIEQLKQQGILAPCVHLP